MNLETKNGSKSTNHRSQTITFWTHLSKVLFPKRFTKMIGGSKKCKHQLTFERQSLRVFEKHSKSDHRENPWKLLKWWAWCQVKGSLRRESYSWVWVMQDLSETKSTDSITNILRLKLLKSLIYFPKKVTMCLHLFYNNLFNIPN